MIRGAEKYAEKGAENWSFFLYINFFLCAFKFFNCIVVFILSVNIFNALLTMSERCSTVHLLCTHRSNRT